MHGYRVVSEVPLTLPVLSSPTAALPALRIQRGEVRSIPWEPPSGRQLARVEDREKGIFYAVTREPGQLRLRFYGVCDFTADESLTDVVAHPDPGVDAAVLPVLIAGTVMSVRMILDGHLVLHASAVEVRGSALAFVGASGMGKSTLATLCCAAGHALVSDDVLRCEINQERTATVWPGATETRLRKAALDLQGLFRAHPASRLTGDGRTAITAPEAGPGPVPLAACVVPLPNRSRTEPEVRRLAPMEALLSLIRFPRVLGWTDQASSARQFDRLAELVQCVPVYEARLPWGPPFRPTLVPDLLEQLQV